MIICKDTIIIININYKKQYLQYFDGEVVFVGVSELAHISLFNTSQLTNTVRDVRNIFWEFRIISL